MADSPVIPIDEAALRKFEEHVAQEDGWEYEWLAESVPSLCAALRVAWQERDEFRAALLKVRTLALSPHPASAREMAGTLNAIYEFAGTVVWGGMFDASEEVGDGETG